MAYSLAVNDVVQVRLRGLLFNQTIRVVVNYRVGFAPPGLDGPTEIGSLLTFLTVAGWWVTEYMNQTTSDLTVNQLVGQRVYPVRQAMVVKPLALNGGLAPPSVSANTGATFIKYTDVSTARKMKLAIGGIGYQHMCGFPEVNRQGSSWNPFFVTGGLTTLGNKLNLPVVTAATTQFVPTIWHKNSSSTRTTDVVTIIPQATVRTERRRTVGVGE